jgi:hypothetical protein
MTHLDIWNTSYGQKKGRESNWQFDSRPLKGKNRLDFLACRWYAAYRWKTFNNSYNFSLNLILIGGPHAKLWGPKVARIPTLAILRLPFGSPGTKCHVDVGLMERHKIYYKGEGGGFPKFGSWWVLWVRVCPWLVLAPKVLQLCLNRLVFGFVQVHVSSWCLSLFLVPSRSSSMPLYPPKNVANQGACPTPCTSVVFTSNLYLSLSRNLGARHMCRY